MKKFIFFVLSLLLLAGCMSTGLSSSDINEKQQFQTEFNETNYVWEHFIFPTNKTVK